MKSGNLNFLEPSGPLQASNGTALPYIYDKRLSSDPEVIGKLYVVVTENKYSRNVVSKGVNKFNILLCSYRAY